MPKFGKKKKKGGPDITDEFGGLSSEESGSENEAGDESDEEEAPIYNVADEDGQVVVDPPMKYQARKKAKIRLMSAMDSPEVGEILKDEFIMVTHTMEVDGILRLRFVRGWTSYKSTKGFNLLLSEKEEIQHYKLTKKEGNVRKEADPESEVVGKLSKNDIFEVLEMLNPPDKYLGKHAYKKQKYIRMHQGWVSTHRCEGKTLGKEVVGVTEKTNLEEDSIFDPEGDAKREAEAIGAAKQAKIDEKEAKKGGKARIGEAKKEMAAVEQFQKDLSAIMAAMPEGCEEECKEKLEACGLAAAEEREKLAREIGASGGSKDQVLEEGEPPEPAK
jgi:hypothetical protein